MMRSTLARLGAIAVVVAVAACGGDDDDDAAVTTDASAAVATTAAAATADTGAATTAAASGDTVAATVGSSAPAADTVAPADQEELGLVMAGSSSSSGVYAFLTAHARLAGEADGNMDIQVRETGASVENFQLVNDGDADFGITSIETLYQARAGEGSFADAPFPDLVNLVNYYRTADFITVRADAGIESIYDLDGKPFAYGFQGSGNAVKTELMLNALGIHPEPFVGGLEDIVNAMKDGRIVGFGKSANGFKADASMIDVASAVPVTLIGFEDADVETMLEQYPYWDFEEIPAGALPEMTEPVTTSVFYASYFVHQDMPEEMAYRLTKAAWATLEQAATEGNAEAGKGRSPEETVETTQFVPVHPGAMRYYEEIGAG